MTHIEEGKIHAWLDGALDAAQSRDVEAHVRQCAQCATSVAEARGLIAGSSRILNALDDVPANVLPIGSKRSPGSPATIAKRRWRAAPWVTSIAAALVLAVALNRNSQKTAMMADNAAMPVAQTVPRESQPTPSSDLVARPVGAPAAASAPTASAPATTAPTGNQRVASSGLTSRQRVAVSAGSGTGAVIGAASGAAAAEQAAIASAQSARVAREERAADMAASAPAAPPPQMLRKAAVPQVARDAAQEQGSDMTGCYSIPVALPPAQSLAASASPRSRADRRSAAPSAAEVVQRGNPVHVVARFIRAVRDSGFAVRDARSDTVLGTWLPLAPDSADVMLKNGLHVRVARSARSDCPAQ